MNAIAFLLLLLAILLIGLGLARLFRVQLPWGILLPVAAITGVAAISFVPFVLQLFYIRITAQTVFTGIGALALLALVPLIIYRKHFPRPAVPVLKVYELPFLLITGFLVAVSVWRCFYNPVAARDMLTGPEVIAQYAVKEHTMINSLFRVDLDINNNPFKPPSVTSLQIIFKLAGFPFGQVWLSILFISFTMFLYRVLLERVHAVIAGVLVLLFLAIPELYSYTFLLLYDYSNMIFLTLSCYFLMAFYRTGRRAAMFFAGLQMGFAVYFRAETLLFAGMLLPLVVTWCYRRRMKTAPAAGLIAAFFLVPVLCYWFPNDLYNKHYLPLKYDAASQINPHLGDLGGLVKRFTDMNKVLIFSDLGASLYCYFFYIFILLFAAELAFKRKFTSEARNWLYCVAMIYFGLPLLGHLIPLIDLSNTTKRGLFKIFPFMLFYFSENQLIRGLSDAIRNWELKPVLKSVPVQEVAPQRAGATKLPAGKVPGRKPGRS